ncbi:MAG: class III signal peptide-containing protein [Candidatus Diapherotrites archaeon]|nr:class III signal peptide-containing protein [Candidatus Diapherotrites archaeon]
MEKKGQGALEYLLLIGGAVLVAAIVIALLAGLPGGSANPANGTFCAGKATFADCTNAGTVQLTNATLTDGTSGKGKCCAYAQDGAGAANQGGFYRCGWANLPVLTDCPAATP